MKTYEEISGSEILDSKKPFIVRLDGSKFSTFTRDFNKPFDPLSKNLGKRKKNRNIEERNK